MNTVKKPMNVSKFVENAMAVLKLDTKKMAEVAKDSSFDKLILLNVLLSTGLAGVIGGFYIGFGIMTTFWMILHYLIFALLFYGVSFAIKMIFEKMYGIKFAEKEICRIMGTSSVLLWLMVVSVFVISPYLLGFLVFAYMGFVLFTYLTKEKKIATDKVAIALGISFGAGVVLAYILYNVWMNMYMRSMMKSMFNSAYGGMDMDFSDFDY